MRQSDRAASESSPTVSFSACLLVFWIVGPGSGYAASLIIAANREFGPPSRSFVASLQAWALLFPFELLVTWILGTLPAVATAAAYWAFPSVLRKSSFVAVLASATVGAAACACLVVALAARLSVLGEMSTWLTYVAPGVVGGAASAFTMQYLQRRWRNEPAG